MANTGLKATLAGLLAIGASGCMSLGGYGAGYGDGYYSDGYGANDYAYNDRCYDAYDGYDDYYSQYDCYDRNDYNNQFSVNIGFGGGWWNDFYYPGYGYYMFDRYGARRQLYGNYARYWGGRRAGYNWHRHGGHRDDYRRDRDRDGPHDGRDRSERRDRSGVGGQIIDRVDRANDRPNRGRGDPRASAPAAIDRSAPETGRPSRQIVDRIDRANRRAPAVVPQSRAPERPARVEQAPVAAPVERARPARASSRRDRQENERVRPD
ncbi:hypothetical protein FSZ31_02365 [Sphingorhabdus soli]|uniref:Uncharacterized protein n=1 Tax=Flavisphingopyxis soli TaxID=2601267 RepID=A0A5C6URX9_9SPHN|nr:hypothetical protein [Sphingorhabdus soli]TXC73608.1 hypothetical protein FSZ31_02365 [Sphingorhabdus soli]